jgi:hypothetical protein
MRGEGSMTTGRGITAQGATDFAVTSTFEPGRTVQAKIAARRWRARRTTFGKASGLLLIFFLVSDMSMGEEIFFRTALGVAVVTMLLIANTVFTGYSLQWFKAEPSRAFALAFILVGLVSVAASTLDLYPKIALLPRRSDYIARHSYFIFLFLPIVIGCFNIWRVGLETLVHFTTRYGWCILLSYPLADLGTAYFFGHLQDGYIFYLDGAIEGNTFALIYLLYVTFRKRRALPLLSMTTHMLLCRILHLGSLFNSLMSLLMYGILALATLATLSPRFRAGSARAIAAMVPAAFFVMAIETYDPALCRAQEKDVSVVFAHSGNTYWRCVVWQANVGYIFDTYFLGVGFGVPYHPLTTENWLASEAAEGEVSVSALAPASEVLYIRGQHSSLINVFYRLGVVGGVLFVLMNWVLILDLARAARGPGVVEQLSLVCCALLVYDLLAISSNVGLESPRYFVLYAIGISLSMACLDWARLRARMALPRERDVGFVGLARKRSQRGDTGTP